MMREQIHQILRAPIGRPRLGRRRGSSSRAPGSPPAGLHGRRGGRRRDEGAAARRTPRAGNEASDLAARLGPPRSPDSCIAPERILVSSPRLCASHGWTARVQLEGGGRPQIAPGRMMMYHPERGWVTYTHDDLAAADSPHRFVLASAGVLAGDPVAEPHSGAISGVLAGDAAALADAAAHSDTGYRAAA
ncbi:unnamed protein product [Urochloa humidicola]